MLSTEQQTQLIDYYFDVLHPELCKDDHNLRLIGQFLRDRTAGPDQMNRAALDWAVADLAGKLHYYQHVDVSEQLQAGAEAQRQLDAANAAAQAERQRIERETLREARQQARQPGPSSAFSSATDRAESERQARLKAQKARDAIILRARHQEFSQLVRQARMEASAEIHSRKLGRWAALYAQIKQRFPESEFTAAF
jgi:hypothetical protein